MNKKAGIGSIEKIVKRQVFTVDKLLIKRVQSEPVLDGFNCGNGSINHAIRDGYYISLLKQAYAYEICIGEDVIGHYRIRIVQISYDDDYHISSAENGYSAVKLDYLAIDKKFQNCGAGTTVLKYIAGRVEQFSTILPIRFFTLDALREKVSWYQKRGFQLYSENNLTVNSETVAMYMDFCDRKKVEEYCNSFGTE